MLYRAFAALIVLFWLGMTALLIRNEVRPGESRLREIPVAHVLKLVFLHEQASSLDIRYEKALVGHLRIHPQVRREDDARVVRFAGDIAFVIPGMNRERIEWDGVVEMTRQLETRLVRIGLKSRAPNPYRAEITLDLVARTGRYQLRSEDRVVEDREYPLDGNSALTLLRELQVPPEMVAMMEAAGAAQPVEFSARQSTLELQGDQLDTSLVSIRQNGQTLLEVHISELGHVLRATTLLGYTLTPDGGG